MFSGLKLGATQNHLLYYAGHAPVTYVETAQDRAPNDGTGMLDIHDDDLQAYFLSANKTYSLPPLYFNIPDKDVIVVGVSIEDAGQLQTFYRRYAATTGGVSFPVTRYRKYTVQFQRYNISYKELI